MPASTPKLAIPYPLPDDSVADYPGVGLDLAETLETLLGSPSVRVRNANNNVCPVNATTTLNFDTEDWDTDGMHAAATPSRLTIVKAGVYLVTLAVIATCAQGVSGNNYLRLRHGAGVEADQTIPFVPAMLSLRMTMSALIRCAVGDYLDAAYYNGLPAGATVTISGGGSFFGAAWLAP
jgi:hypothetical protein